MNEWNDTQYVILQKLGEGGMGTVFLAEDPLLKRKVAIKELNKPHSSNLETLDERFQQEALALARLNHPNITHLYSFLPRQGTYWMVMEYVLGESLEQLLQKRGHTTPLAAASILGQLLDGLNHAHKKGIIHRDLKPGNVMISEEGEIKIMDFGIARIRDSQRITQHGKSVGTLQYMAPEQIKGLEGDERTDVYAAGTILYELLAGSPPFRFDTDYQLMKAKLEENTAALPSSVPPTLQRVIAKAMDRNPDKRYTNVLALKEAIEFCFTNKLLRDTELFNELNKPAVPDVESFVNRVLSQKSKPSFLSSAVASKVNSSKATLKNISEIRSNSALYLLIAVVIICSGLLIWNSSRQQNVVEHAGLDTSEVRTTNAIPFNEPEMDTVKPASSLEDRSIIESRELPNNISVSSDNLENDNQNIKIKKASLDNALTEKISNQKATLKKPVATNISNKTNSDTSTSKVETAAPVEVAEEKNTNESREEYKGSVKIPAGLQIAVVLDETLSSEETSKDGKQVKLHCSEDIKAGGGRTVIRKGAHVTGKIVDVVPSYKRGKAVIGFIIQYVEAVNGDKIKLHSDRQRQFAEEPGKSALFKEGQIFYVKLGKGEID